MAIVTKVKWDRELTQSELDQINTYIAAQVQAGTTDGINYVNEVTTVRLWQTPESATAYISVENSLSPPPILAQILY